MPGKRRRDQSLTPGEIARILGAYRRGKLQREIAAEFNITQARVSHVVNQPRG
jgi:DNA-binding MarR family transcriptional regulator